MVSSKHLQLEEENISGTFYGAVNVCSKQIIFLIIRLVLVSHLNLIKCFHWITIVYSDFSDEK